MTIETILIPTDGSEQAEAAARRGFEFAKQLSAAVHLVSVADVAIAATAGYSGDSPRIRTHLREQAETYVSRLEPAARDRDLDVTTAVCEGIPGETLVEYAEHLAVDAILIGTSGRGGVARTVIGSVADKVIRTASVPVIALTRDAVDREDGSVDSILLPTDGSDAAEAAAGRGIDLAAQLSVPVHLLFVADEDVSGGLASLFSDAERDSVEQLRQGGGDHLARLGAAAREQGVEFVAATREGNPVEEIVDNATENGIDMVVMGTHGRGGFERFLVGSVTDRVIRTAPVPVMAVRSNESRRKPNGSAIKD